MSAEVSLPRRFEHLLALGVRRLLLALPHRAARPLGSALGAAIGALDRRHLRIGHRNLSMAMPELSPADRKTLLARCYRHFGRTLCDAVSLGRFDPVGLCARLTLEGWEHLEAASRPGRGLFILTAHLGHWEIVGDALALYKGPTHVVARPTHNPLVEAMVRRHRERFGNVTIYKRGAARKMLRAVREGGRVAFLLDQRVHPNEGIEVPFFGQPSFTSPLLAGLSIRAAAPVVPVFGYPARGGRFRVVARPALFPEGAGDEAVAALTARYLRVIEEAIRERPEMWLWMHERWRKH